MTNNITQLEPTTMPCKSRAKSLKKSPNKPKSSQKKTKKLKRLTKREKRAAKNAIRRLKRQPKIGTPEFRALQVAWYDRLERAGFINQERLDSDGTTDGMLLNRNSPALAVIARSYNRATETYYRRLTNFLTHNPKWGTKLEHAASVLYSEGVPYRTIVKRLKSRNFKTNIWRVHHIVQDLNAASNAWNRQHPDGLDFEADVG